MIASQLVLPRILPSIAPVDLAFAAGSMTAVVGANGCGKSTLLSVLCGLLQPQAGRVELAGFDIARMPTAERARHIAWVASTPPRGSALTVRATLELAARCGPMAGAVSTETILDQFGLMAHADTALDRLSDGWAQRAMIARALAQNTRVIVLDEPTAFLDLPATVAVFDALELALNQGRTVILSSHDFTALERSNKVTNTLLFSRSHIADMSGFNAAVVSKELLA